MRLATILLSAALCGLAADLAAAQTSLADNPPGQAPGAPRRKMPPPPPLLPDVTGQPSGPQGDSWDALAKTPDFSGSWLYDMHPAQVTSGEFVPLTPPFVKKMDEQRARSKVGGDIPAAAYHCMPRGVPEIMQLVTRIYEFLPTPGLITIIPQNNEVRFVYMDGRKHPEKGKLTENGHSVGHWEGDMLVIDTVDIKPGTDMFYGFPGGSKQHVLERFRLTAENHLQTDITMTDPTSLTKPYTYSRTYTRHKEWPMTEEICLQNNRDLSDQGTQQFDLTPPPGLK